VQFADAGPFLPGEFADGLLGRDVLLLSGRRFVAVFDRDRPSLVDLDHLVGDRHRRDRPDGRVQHVAGLDAGVGFERVDLSLFDVAQDRRVVVGVRHEEASGFHVRA